MVRFVWLHRAFIEMNSNLFIRYRGVDPTDDSAIEMSCFGESVIGFDVVIKEIVALANIQGEVEIKVNCIREGSLIVEIIVCIKSIANQIEFGTVSDLLAFLKVANELLWQQATAYFGSLEATHRDLNTFASEYPLDMALFGYFIQKILKQIPFHKKLPDINQLPKEYAMGIHRAIKKKKFKRAMRPFIENELKTMEVSDTKNFKATNTCMIDSSNFEGYLSEDEEKILPDYENGKNYRFTGTIVGIQCIRGDSMKVRIHGFSKRDRDLVAFPPSNKTSADFHHFYGKDKNIVMEVKIIRDSMYQKPKLEIIEVSLQNQPLV